jgi:hypothetical protein
VAGGDSGEGGRGGVVGFEELAAGHGVPGQEADALLLAVLERFLMTAVGETVSILDSDDVDDLAGFLDLGRGDFAEADVADFALLLHALEGAEGFFERGARVDAMELIEVDALELEAAQAHLDTLDEVAGAAHVLGLGGPWRVMPPLVAMTRPLDRALGPSGASAMRRSAISGP